MKAWVAQLLVLGSSALLAGLGIDSARAATPQPAGFTTRVDPPSEVVPLAGGSGSDGIAFTTRLGDVASTFSIDRTAGRDVLPRMLWSRPLGATLAGARFEHDGWSFGVSAGFGGSDLGVTGSGTSLLQPGAATRRNGVATGLEYDFGPWQLGGYYQFSHSDIGFTPPGKAENAYGLGANYTVAPGMHLFSEAFFYNDAAGRSSLAVSPSTGGNLKPQNGQLYVIGTHLEW